MSVAALERSLVRHRTITTEMIEWDGLHILLCFEADWLGLGATFREPALAHMEMQVLFPRGAPLPLSDTGYWSDFFSPIDAMEAGGAKRLALRLLEEFTQTQSWRVNWARWEQSPDPG